MRYGFGNGVGWVPKAPRTEALRDSQEVGQMDLFWDAVFLIGLLFVVAKGAEWALARWRL